MLFINFNTIFHHLFFFSFLTTDQLRTAFHSEKYLRSWNFDGPFQRPFGTGGQLELAFGQEEERNDWVYWTVWIRCPGISDPQKYEALVETSA